ncbi:MAG: STAS domain-containing protein [Candidatus Krumholzibacteriota bacterium]
MPRELTRQLVRHRDTGSQLEIEVRHTERAVWVALSGILDRQGMQRVISRVAPRLANRGCRIILDGKRLAHLDYRATHGLLVWNRKLRDHHHQLFLHGWSDYLKAILVMEDWDRELGAMPTEPSTWRLLSGASAERAP